MSITAHTVLFLLVLASFGCNESDLPDLEQQLNTLEQELVVATKRVEELELHLATTEETASKFIAVQEKLNGEIKDLKQRIESISATNEEAAKKLAIRMDDLVRHAAVMDEKIAAFAGRPPGEPPQVKQAPPRPVIRSSYFYDMDAKKLFMAEANMIPPIDAPSGGKAVIAHVFACDSCANNQDMFIGYLSNYSDDARRILTQPGGASSAHERNVVVQGSLVRTIDAESWFTRVSAEGIAITRQVASRCHGKRLVQCYP